MLRSYICCNHREWLRDQPEQAIHCYANACEAGWNLYQQKRWQEALPFVGTAFEAAEILLSCRLLSIEQAIEWYINALNGLSRTLKRLGDFEQCHAVQRHAMSRLGAIRAETPSISADLSRQIARLESASIDPTKQAASLSVVGSDSAAASRYSLH